MRLNRVLNYNARMDSLKDKLKNLPQSPGVYLYKDKHGRVIYVGKAKNLRARAAQYFGADKRPQIPFLINQAEDLDYTVTASELEALFLENTLIKQYLPRYNILLRDDKNYAFIKIDYSSQIPRIGYARKIENATSNHKSLIINHKSVYFGPYSSAKKIKDTLDFVRKIFPFCANAKVSQRPCFYYYLHKCPGVCVGQISLSDYQKQIARIALFLSGKTVEVKKNLKTAMLSAAKRKKFEIAARLRDQLRALEILEERQNAIFPQKVNWDFISLAREGGAACVNLFKIRVGKLIDKENFIYQTADSLKSVRILYYQTQKELSETLQTFLENYYSEASALPQAIFLQTKISNPALIQLLLQRRSGKRIKLLAPKRGKKAQLIRLGQINAAEYLRKWQNTSATSLAQIQTALGNLQTLLKLPSLPLRIEAYDISNLQGTNPVGSMVVFENGLPAKARYRKFKINVKTTPDDFAMMKEMLTRRLIHLNNSPVPPLKVSGGQGQLWPRPDLMVIDGGKGQLNVALKILKTYNLKLKTVGLAKRLEEIFVPGKKNPIILPHSDPALQLLQRLRDEAHRFAITFHRQLRSKHAQISALDEISGIGPKTKKLLKAEFGTAKAIKLAGFFELAKIIGSKKAQLLQKTFQFYPKSYPKSQHGNQRGSQR